MLSINERTNYFLPTVFVTIPYEDTLYYRLAITAIYPQVTALHKYLDMIFISSALPIAGNSFCHTFSYDET